MPRVSDVEQPVAGLDGVHLGRADAQQVAVAHHAEHDVAQMPRGPPTSVCSTCRSAMASPASGVSRSSIISTTLGVVVARPSSRPAVSEETTTESAPDCCNRCWFSASRIDATILALGAISRAVNVTSTAVSSRLVATTIDAACCAPASRSTSDLVASPCTVTSPAVAACSRALWSVSTTTTSPWAASSPRIAATAVLPLVP